MIRVILADDHHLVRQGIRALLEKLDDIEVIGEADDGQQALDLTVQLKPDVLIIDIAMPHLNGIQVLEQLQPLNLPTRAIILSMHADEILTRQALQYGVTGYLLKRSVSEELDLAIQAACRGEIYFCPAIGSIVAESLRALASPASKGESAFDRLSPRESQVLKLIAEGHTNRSVAQLMNISAKTVEKHRASLMDKLNTHDLAGLIQIAIKYGLIFLER